MKIIALIIIMNSCFKNYNILKNINKDINSELVFAINNDEIDKAIELVNKGADINSIFEGKSILDLSLQKANLKLIEELVKREVQIKKDNIEKLYNLALEDFNYKIIDLIKDKYKLEEGLIDNDKYFLLLCYTSNADRVRKFIEKNNINPSEVKDKSKRTGLIISIVGNRTDVFKMLVEEYGLNINHKMDNGATPLIAASSKNNKELIKFIIKKGANVNDKGSIGWAPLMYASKSGCKEIVELLVEKGANINDKNNSGWTPLMLASENGNKEVIELLIQKGASINNEENRGFTALMLVVKKGNKEIIKLLIEKDSDVNYKNSSGWTPLMLASGNGNKEVVELLIQKGANIDHKQKDGWTALMIASRKGYKDVVELLGNSNIDHQAKDGSTALVIASENNHKDVVKLLLEKGANPNKKDNEDLTPLMVSSKNGYKEIVELLIEKGANINLKSKEKATSLIYALNKGYEDIAKLFLENFCEIGDAELNGLIEKTLIDNIKKENMEVSLFLINSYGNRINFTFKDDEGNTFLHYTAAVQSYKLFNLLLSNNCNINEMNKNGETPLYFALAKTNFNQSFILYLINNQALLKPCSYVEDKALIEVLMPFEEICEKLVYTPLINKLVTRIHIRLNLNIETKAILKEVIKKLRLKEDDFSENKKMIDFIRNTLVNPNTALNINQIKVNEDIDQDIELNIEVFDEIFRYFDKHDYWDSIVQKGIDKVKEDFRKKLLIIEQYKPVNKPLLSMNSEERLKNTNFRRKEKLAKLLRLISRTAENGYNNDKIKFVVNQTLDIVACSEGSLEAIEDAIRYLSGEETTEIKDIINDELMHLRYNILKEICINRIKVRVNGIEEIADITPHTFPQLVKEMSKELKLKLSYLDERDYNFTYNKNEIVKLVIDKYKEKILEYTRDKIEENRVLWNKVRDYIEREIFKCRAVLEIENFIYDDEYKIKKEAVRALLINLNLY